MKKFLLLSIIILKINLYCAFINQNFSARNNALSEASTALADDVSCIVFNPAGLRQVLTKTLSVSYYKPYLGLQGIDINLSNLTYSHPLQNIGVFGLSFSFFDASGIYKENILYLTYSNKLNDFLDLENEIYSGITLKFLNHSYNWDEETKLIAESLSDPVITKGSSASAFTLDIGSIIRLGKMFYIGMSFLNILPANVGIYYEDIVPFESRIGISFRRPINRNIVKKLNLNCDISYRAQEWGEFKDKLNLHSSIEVYIYESFVLRSGINFDNFSLGFSYLKEFKKSLNLEFLYSFSLPFRLTDNFGSHNISIVYSFGKPIEDKKKEVIEEKIKVKEEILKEIFKEEKETIETIETIEEPVKKEQEEQQIKQEPLQPSTTEQQTTPTKSKPKKDEKEIREDELEKDIMKKLLELEEKK